MAATVGFAAATAVACALVLPSPPALAASYAEAARLYDGGQVRAAIEQYRELAAQGLAQAQVALAGLYEAGEVTGAPDFAMAVHWYRRAAVQGDPVAQMNLGDIYASGRGVERDPVRAWVWLTRAARQGRDWAARRRDGVARAMTSEQLAAARQRLAAGGAPP